MAKHLENFTMQVAKAHRLDHDKLPAYQAYLQNLIAQQRRKMRKMSHRHAVVPKTSLMPVLVPLLVSANAFTVATSVVFMQKSGRGVRKRNSVPARFA